MRVSCVFRLSIELGFACWAYRIGWDLLRSKGHAVLKAKNSSECCGCFGGLSDSKKIFPKEFDKRRATCYYGDMDMTRVPGIPTGDSLTEARLALLQQAAAPVDKSAGGGVLA